MPRASEQEQARRIAAELSGVVERAVSSLAAGVLDGVAANTPKDTGASAASWQVASRTNGPVVGRSRSAVAAAKSAQAASRLKVAGYKLAQGRVFIGSSQPGIRGLNNGTSAREPAGFVQRSITKAVATTRVLTLSTGRGRGRGGRSNGR